MVVEWVGGVLVEGEQAFLVRDFAVGESDHTPIKEGQKILYSL
jgi:hypothetical protein